MQALDLVGTRNEEEKAILEFVLLFISSDTYFKKRNHTFVSGGNFSQIVVILSKRQDKVACKDRKVIPVKAPTN